MATLIKILLTLLLSFTLSSCTVAQIATGGEQKPEVSALPLPTLPSWIEEISPTGDTETLAQIRIRFSDALIPLESLDSPNQTQLLKKFEVIPSLPGQFRFLTPRMVGFEADKAIPKGGRFQVTLKAGLADLKNHKLEQDLAWTFNTEKIKITNLTKTNLEQGDEPLSLEPILSFNSNVELDLASLKEHLNLKASGTNKTVPVDIYLKEQKDGEDYESETEVFAPSQKLWNYNIKPKSKLDKATKYSLEITPGLRSIDGNLPTETSFSSEFYTYAPLAFKELDFYGKPDGGGAYGRFVNGSPLLKFNNGLVAETAIKNISIIPQPKKEKKIVQVYENDPVIQLNPWALEPATEYTITMGPNLKDKFGQKLGKAVTVNYNTGDIAADIWAPSGLNIFPTDNNLQLNISTVNLPESQYQAAFKVVQPTDLIYHDSADGYGGKKGLLPPSNTWASFAAGGKKNETYENSIPLREKLGKKTGMLAYGVKAKTNTYSQDGKELWREPEYNGLVQLTNLGVFTQWFPNSGLIRVNHLSDGGGVKNARVEVYKSQLETKTGGNSQPCLVTKTDNQGMVMLGEEEVRQCFNKQAPQLLVIAREGEDWSFTRTYEYSGSYEYGIYAGWDEGKPISRGVIFSDRQLYQPGETAYFTGTAYYLQDGILQQDKNTVYDITLVNPEGKETNLGSQTTSDYGTFSLELPLERILPLGYYSLKAKSSNGVEIYGDFRVAEFKPPNFKVDLALSKNYAFAQEKVTATVESKYLFGVPVEGGKAKYYVTRQPSNFTPKGWEKFSFGPQWFWPEERPEVSTDVLQSGEIPLDGAGKNSQEIAVTEELPYPMDYNVEVQVTDVSNLSVAQSKVFTALPSGKLIGLNHDFVANGDKAFPVELIVTDAEGKVISGEKVRLELQEMAYSSVTQLQEGSATEKHQMEYKTVAKTDVVSGDTPQTVNLTATKSGAYRIRANFVRGGEEATATDTQIWVSGKDIVAWGNRYEDDRIEIKLDKDSYKPGETATALIQSPYPEAELYFAVIRHRVMHSQLLKVKGSAPKIQFTVTPEMLPNAAVEAVLVRQGKPLTTLPPDGGEIGEKLSRIGFTPFKVDLGDKYLQAKVIPNQEKLAPGNEQSLELTLKDKQGNPIAGQFTVMVVNEAILQLTGYRLPDLVTTVYAQQDISTRLADNRPDVVTQSLASPLQKGWGFGGGFDAALGDTKIRKNFQATAYYNGAVETDGQGLARVTFTLPDDLTTWRVMAVATDGNLNFGGAEATFITTKPLVSNPILPQFVRLGDRFFGGVSLTNTTGATGTLSLRGNIGEGLQFEETPSLSTDAQVGTKAYLFPLTATKAGETKVQFSSQLNQETDALEVPLEVKELTLSESVVESGVTQDRVTIPVNIDKNVLPDMGGLKIDLASTLLPEITAPATEVFAEDWLPFGDNSAAKLAIAANLKILGEKYPQILTTYNLNQEGNKALEQLAKLQQPDGGFSYLPKQSQSNPFVSVYAAQTIAQAQSAGIEINQEMVSRLKQYLNDTLANPTKDDWCSAQRCQNSLRLKTLMALAALGDKRQDFLQSIYAGKNELSLGEQIQLARCLWQLPSWQQQAENMTQEIAEIVYQTGRSAVVNKSENWWWFNSSTNEQSQALQLFISARSEPELIDKLLKGLLDLRRNGTWQTAYDNAQALTALVAYSNLEPTPPNYNATVKLDNQVKETVSFEGYINPSRQVNLPMSSLTQGRRNLTLSKTGKGQLHYLTEYNYRLKGNQPGQLNGLRVTRYVHPVNQKETIAKMSIYNADNTLQLGLGQVFDLELEIIADRPVNNVVILDQLPAGLEAIDTSFQTSSSYFVPQESSWAIAYQQIYKDRIVAYADKFSPGVYRLHYLVRSVTQGSFDWPGAEARLQYAPEEFGRCASLRLEIK
jgi:uncharacterized protein YfaS (alpha-2-macroglobulin family)